MTTRDSLRYQLIAAWCGIWFEVLYTISWAVLGHNLPPPSPSLSAPDLAAFYLQHHNQILLGNSLAALVGVLWVPWTAQLAVTMRRIEGGSPVLTIIQVIGGVLTAWALMFCPAVWATAAFRPDADPALTRLLNDVGFMMFNLTYAGTSLQAIAAGLVGLADKSESPVFPRWVSGWAVFTGLSFIPITAMPFDKTGPLAWNGLITFWGLFGTYFVWSASMGWSMVKDTRRRLQQETGTDQRLAGGRPIAGRA